MLGALNIKLIRDLWQIKGQMAAITLVMAAGIAVFVLMFGVLDSLRLTQTTYYERYKFADVFASLKRAPETLMERINTIPGVSVAESRVISSVTLQMPEMSEPVSGKIISLPENKQPLLNQLYLQSGRFLQAHEDNAVLVDDGFFKAHELSLGDKVSVIINGYQRQLKIVGVALSPEYVYSIAPGALMPDNKRYGIFWMNRSSLEASVNMKGAFNDVTVKVERRANLLGIKEQLDALTKPYGGLIAYGRDEQLSNFVVDNELKQLESMGFLAPVIFLSVAAFLINVVMSRQIATQRVQIGMLKAVGYTDIQIALHFLKMVLLITALGAILGLSVGAWMGTGMTKMYTDFLHFPILKYSFSIEVMVFAVFCCTIAAVAGTLFAIYRAAKLAPAEAMRPESPTHFRASILEHLGIHRHLSFLSRIVLRQIERRPIRALLSAIGMAFALSILIFSYFMEDSMTYLMDIQYDYTQREDLSVNFTDARPYKALEEIKVMPGVLSVEPVRSVPVHLKVNHYSKRTSITGLVRTPDLRRVIDLKLNPVSMPEHGLVMNDKLAEILHVKVGDVIRVEVLEGKRSRLKIPVTGITQEYIGLGVFMSLDELHKQLDESPKITGAAIMVDSNFSPALYQTIKSIPMIAGMSATANLKTQFEEIMAESLLEMMATNILFASFISFGVIYNTARISLSERGRELASLRVLGLSRGEVAYILFGELGIITLISIPMGIAIGIGFVSAMVHSMDSELFRIPQYFNSSTFGYAVIIVLLSAVFSFYLVWRRVDKIDLVSAQKGVE